MITSLRPPWPAGAAAVPTPSAAAPASGHGKRVIVQSPSHPGLNHRFQIAGNKGQHADALFLGPRFNLPGNRPADQLPYALLPQQPQLGVRIGLIQVHFVPLDYLGAPELQNQRGAGGIEYRGDALVPDGYCQLHTLFIA